MILALDDDVVAARGLVTAHASRHARTHDLVVMGYMPVAQSGLELRHRPAARYFGCTYEDACRRFDFLPRTMLEGFWGGHFSVRRWIGSASVALAGFRAATTTISSTVCF